VKNKKILLGLIVVLFALFCLFGTSTPITAEAQLIGKVLILVNLCSIVIKVLLGVFEITSKQRSLKDFIIEIALYIFSISLILFLINVPFDYVMSVLDNREIPNKGCAIIAVALFLTTLFLSKLFKNCFDRKS
jgi:hypothetical protein